jgi:hypothetical protein
MANEVPKAVFLAGSTVELISALACLAGLGISDAIVFVERNISFGAAAMDPLLAAARSRFPTVRFIELEIKRPVPKKLGEREWNSFINRWQEARSIRRQLDAACRAHFGMGLKSFGARLQDVYFTGLHDYVLVFLAASREKARVFYPHGFDHPRRQQVRDNGYVLCRRSLRTAFETLAQQRKEFGPGGLLLGILGRLLPGTSTVSLPFTGVDRVLTFRTDVDYVPNEVVKVQGLVDTFQWLLQLQPWGDLLRDREGRIRGGSLLLLLPEYNCHPIWEKNRSYGLAHLRLLQTMSQATGLKRFVIKAHVRSDGSAAEWLARFLKEQEKAWEIEILPAALHGLPVEALALTGEFAAACSLGSCSLPPGLGFGIPHYVSPAASALFDEGWQAERFWEKFADSARMLIEEGICRDIDKDSKEGVGNRIEPGSTVEATDKNP